MKFKRLDGSPLRVFDSVEEMDEHIIERWNSVVKPSSKVYHLGDVAMRRADIATIGRCNGHKRLVRGNHDDHALKHYLLFFEEVYGTRRIDDLIFSHIPLHPDSLGKRVKGNVHGHTHSSPSPGPRYLNVCVEAIDYTPISLEEAKARLAKQQAEAPNVEK